MNYLKSALQDSVGLKSSVLADDSFLSDFLVIAELLLAARRQSGTIYTCGNGGSACDAIHFVEELIARYAKERKGIKAAHFMDAGVITCWSNDYDFNSLFARQVETQCEEKDVLIAFTTSGNSENIIQALNVAKEKNVKTVALTGKDGGKAKDLADYTLVVPHQRTDRIQEVHILLVHAFCEYLEAED